MLLLRGSPAAVRYAGQDVPNRGLCDPLATGNNGTGRQAAVNGAIAGAYSGATMLVASSRRMGSGNWSH